MQPTSIFAHTWPGLSGARRPASVRDVPAVAASAKTDAALTARPPLAPPSGRAAPRPIPGAITAAGTAPYFGAQGGAHGGARVSTAASSTARAVTLAAPPAPRPAYSGTSKGKSSSTTVGCTTALVRLLARLQARREQPVEWVKSGATQPPLSSSVAELQVKLPRPLAAVLRDKRVTRTTEHHLAAGNLSSASRLVEQFQEAYWRHLQSAAGTAFAAQRQHVVVCSGMQSGINTAIMAFTREGSQVLIVEPSYGPLRRNPEQLRRTVLVSSLVARQPEAAGDHGTATFALDEKDFLAKAAQAELFLMCSPNNPLGKTFTLQELHVVARAMQANGKLYVLSDELHGAWVHGDAPFISFGQFIATHYPDLLPRVVVLTGLSKQFPLAAHALPAVALFGHDHTAALWEKGGGTALRDNPNTVGLLMALRVLRGDLRAWTAEFSRQLHERCQEALQGVQQIFPGGQTAAPDAGFLLFVDVAGDLRRRGCTRSAQDFFAQLNRGSYKISPGGNFSAAAGSAWQGYFRLNFAKSAAELRKELEFIRKVYAEFLEQAPGVGLNA